ncbi:hypothetical protein [Massilia sp. 9I]|uniref:hypothetical protein n=1 Tax=Massilia sp. 9I TaxID=2653152 RepID=UPI0012F08829|nr:hypothetical protein [Massilia sp. 9I]VXB40256.1 conserved membrane hypothetical protein [Massilia sp. 9I]
MGSNSAASLSAKAQTVCIDLPGESVQCWRSTDKVQVVLKKHRDVVFDLKLGSQRSYTVESTGSDFYDAEKKKLVAGQGKQRVLFNDGERLHLWVGRNFSGELLLKSAGQLMMKLDPRKLDAKQYDESPSTKPDPIIIAIGGSAQGTDARKTGAMQHMAKQQLSSPSAQARPVAATVDDEWPIVCVIDTILKDLPAWIWKTLGSGGGKSGLADLDPNEIATRNWLLGQLAGAAAYAGDNWDWLKASIDGKTHAGFKLVKARIHKVNEKVRFYFSGYSKSNGVFKQGGFGPGHERVMNIFSGAGKVSTAVSGIGKGVLSTFKSNALVSFIFGSAAALAEWKADASKDGYDLTASLMMNVVKSVLVAALTTAIVTCITAFILLAMGASVSVLAVGALTIGVGVAITYAVDFADKKLGQAVGGEGNQGGLSEVLASRIRQNVESNWLYLKRKLLWDYEEVAF